MVPPYLQDLQKAAEAGHLTEKKLLEFPEQLIACVTSPQARAVLSALKIEPKSLFRELDGRKLPKLSSFLSKRLSRAIP